MGLGVHGGGLGVARFLVAQGADVTVTDLRDADALRSSLDAMAGLPVRYVLGEHREEDFASAQLIIKNPGVPASSRFLQIGREHGAQIETEMTLFFRLCQGPILGITGTKGKTTTTSLVAAMLRAQIPETVVAGNLRISALEQLPKIGPGTPVVLELSSFALENLGDAGLSPQLACVTNLSPDHLDRYATMESYGEAKRQVFLHQGAAGTVVLNAADPVVAAWAAAAPGAVVWFAPEGAGAALPHVAYGPSGLWWHAADAAPAQICPLDEVAIIGAHNLANAAAASALALAFGVRPEHIRAVLASFTGVEHRLEHVRDLGGVRYINDTAATVPEAAVAALRSFAQPIVQICGGSDKRLDLGGLAREIVARAKAAVLLEGTATPKLLAAIEAEWQQAHPGRPLADLVSGPHASFAEAVAAAHALAAPGDVVLLSPGCASFGMFRNEFHRGEEFRRLVHEL